jgi:hypothetical protein
MSLASTIEALATGTYVVQRAAVGTYTKGVYAAGAVTTLQIVAMVVPASGHDLRRLPEGRSATGIVAVLTRTALALGDVLVDAGQSYEVEHLENWNATGGFYKALARRKQ